MVVVISLASSFMALESTVGIGLKVTKYLAFMNILLKFAFIIFLAVMFFHILLDEYKHSDGLPILNIMSVTLMTVQWDDYMEEERHVTATKAGNEEILILVGM